MKPKLVRKLTLQHQVAGCVLERSAKMKSKVSKDYCFSQIGSCWVGINSDLKAFHMLMISFFRIGIGRLLELETNRYLLEPLTFHIGQ